MNKNQIMEYLNTVPKNYMTNQIITKINASLDDNTLYNFYGSHNNFSITSEIFPGKNGSYLEIHYAHDEATHNNSLVVTTKSYAPAFQMRYFYEEVGLDIFTQSNSYVYTEQGRLLHHSWFSDEHKYYGSHQMPLDYSIESLKRYFSDTTPKYQNGYFVSGPNSAYQPFTNIWQRYGATNVFREYGRSPINGEYSEIGVTFDNNISEDIKLLNESYGQIYTRGREMLIHGEDNVVSTIDRIYRESTNDGEFDFEGFHNKFETTMYKPKEYHY